MKKAMLLVFIVVSCQGQRQQKETVQENETKNVYEKVINDTAMVERFNLAALEGLSYQSTVLQKGEWVIDMLYDKETRTGFQDEYAPAKDFYVIQKTFHPNGVLQYRAKFLGDVSFGYREYFDEKGQLIEAIDEDAKFGKIKPQDLVNIIEKTGWINRKTGEYKFRKTSLQTDGHFYLSVFSAYDGKQLHIHFTPAQYTDEGIEIKPPEWYFGAYYQGLGHIYYIVDGNTGKYEYYEEDFSFDE